MTPSAIIADDDEFFRIALINILRTRLCFKDVAATGSFDDAVAIIRRIPNLELAVFDLRMPGIDSAVNFAAVREYAPALKVVVCSGSSARQDVLLSLTAGVHGYIPKNIGVEGLLSALERILDGQIYVPSVLSQIEPATSEAIANTSIGVDLGQVLTPRQLDVLKHLVTGQSNKEIARNLNLGEGTVKIHVAALFRALGVSSRAAAAVVGAAALGIAC